MKQNRNYLSALANVSNGYHYSWIQLTEMLVKDNPKLFACQSRNCICFTGICILPM